MDVFFAIVFLGTTVVVGGLFVRGFLRLLSFRDPVPPGQDAANGS